LRVRADLPSWSSDLERLNAAKDQLQRLLVKQAKAVRW
jgi:hypothetical protein